MEHPQNVGCGTIAVSRDPTIGYIVNRDEISILKSHQHLHADGGTTFITKFTEFKMLKP